MYGVELLGSCDSADHVMPSSYIKRVKHIGLPGKFRLISKVVNNYQYLEQSFKVLLLSLVSELLLCINDIMQRFRIVMVNVDRILVCMLKTHLVFNVLLHW